MFGFRYRPEILQGIPDHETTYLKQYEHWFILEPEQLKRITDHFVRELEQGLSKEGGNIPMNPTWVMGFPSGYETGRILTLDMGGTNLRVCRVYLSSRKRHFEQIQRTFKLPEEIKTGTGEQLWDFIAGRLELFLKENNITSEHDGTMPLSFTFSFPVKQKSIRSGILQRWTKNFNVSGVEGHDVVPQLEAAFLRQKLPVRIVALLNDTTGTLIASHYIDPKVKVGSIFSTGCNAAYMEECKLIPKLEDAALPDKASVIINTEYGAFDNDRKVLPLNPFDWQIDGESARPGTQIYEKMVSGLYIGEMLRLILVTLHEQGKLFKGLDITRLRHENSLEASFLSVAELDFSEDLGDMREEFTESLSLSPDLNDLKVCRYLIGLVATRAARLYACGIAAICKKKNMKRCHIGVNGSAFNKYSAFKGRAAQGLRDIFDWPPDELDWIALNPSEDGSGVGAALAAALIIEGDHKANPL
ncbi:Hexokinase [Penicillium frequentans]|nr:Hexokinase [Penicillium glabrum]